MKDNGKYEEKRVQQRKKNRIIRASCQVIQMVEIMSSKYLQKLTNRQMALKKTTSVIEEYKKKFEPCLVQEVISSEESSDEGEFIVRPLPWRSDQLTELFLGLDRKHNKRASPRSKRMSFSRKQGMPSDQPKPSNLPDWFFK